MSLGINDLDTFRFVLDYGAQTGFAIGKPGLNLLKFGNISRSGKYAQYLAFGVTVHGGVIEDIGDPARSVANS